MKIQKFIASIILKSNENYDELYNLFHFFFNLLLTESGKPITPVQG
jgi:hypothetical protein